MCLNICQHIGGSILATTHYPKSYVIYILYVISFWSFSWYFGASSNYNYHQKPNMTPPVNRSMSLTPDVYINSHFELSDDAQESIIVHHINVQTNYYCRFICLSSKFSICLYTKVYNGRGTLNISCVLNSWMFFIIYWVSLVVCMSAISLGVAGSIY